VKFKAVVGVTLLAGALGMGWALLGQRWLEQAGQLPFLGKIGEHTRKHLPDLRLPELSGREFGGELKGQVVVLNFWATWCGPCREEIPMFNAVQEAYGKTGLQFIGVAIDDATAVEAFVKTTPIRYPVLIGGVDAIETSRQLGNRLQGLPFSAIFDRNGNLVYAQTGPLTRGLLEERITPLL
jgi:thiol-disulfide isomerase/thioredoxin